MSNLIETIQVASTDPASQGPFVVINKSDFDPKVHKLHDPKVEAKAKVAAPKSGTGSTTPTTEA